MPVPKGPNSFTSTSTPMLCSASVEASQEVRVHIDGKGKRALYRRETFQAGKQKAKTPRLTFLLSLSCQPKHSLLSQAVVTFQDKSNNVCTSCVRIQGVFENAKVRTCLSCKRELFVSSVALHYEAWKMLLFFWKLTLGFVLSFCWYFSCYWLKISIFLLHSEVCDLKQIISFHFSFLEYLLFMPKCAGASPQSRSFIFHFFHCRKFSFLFESTV